MKKYYYTLRNGVKMPPVGFGTDMTFLFVRKNIIKGFVGLIKDILFNKRYYTKRDLSIFRILKNAMKEDCCLIDTASAYAQSERVVGIAFRNSNRDDIFVVTKMSNKEQREMSAEKALKRSLKKLKMDYVDLYLLHWPQTGTYIEAWKQMEQIYEMGLAKAIGVCNFKPHHFEELKKYANIMPMVNQVECHPLFVQNETYEYCKKHGIQMMAYTPTGRMHQKLRENDILKELAAKYNKSIAQVIIRWHFQRGVIPIINTTKLKHLRENLDVFDFVLSEQDFQKIGEIDENLRLRYDPDKVDFNMC